MADNTYETHEKLYLLDGNVAIFAPRSPGNFVVFRVHQSMLSRISPVFESMFTLPPGAAEEKYDGVPLVYLPDSADAVENLLMIVYHESALPFKRLDPRTPYSVKCILSLANKYGMDRFRHRIVEHIEGDWPRSLWQWDKLESEINSMLYTWTLGCHDNPEYLYSDDHLPEPASAIRLARECDISSILPAAFYHLSRLSIHDDREKAGLPHAKGHPQCELSDGHRTAEWRLLTNEDFISLLKGQAKLCMAANEMLCFAECQQEHWSGSCSASKRLELFQEIQDACHHSSDILRTTRCYIEKRAYGEDICQLCCAFIRKDLTAFRQQLWDKLPEFFSLR